MMILQLRNASRLLLLLVIMASAVLYGCGQIYTPEEHVLRAQEYREKGNDTAAIVELKNALQQEPQMPIFDCFSDVSIWNQETAPLLKRNCGWRLNMACLPRMLLFRWRDPCLTRASLKKL